MDTQVQPTQSSWGLSKKISITLVMMSIAGVIISSAVAFFLISQKSDSAIKQELSIKSNQTVQSLETLFGNFSSDLHLIARSPSTQQALFSFVRAWEIYVGVAEKDLPDLYIQNNPNPPDQRDKLDFAQDDTSAYGQVHLKHHGWFREFIQTKGYEDLMLIDRQGNVIYSVKKNTDFASNISLGALRDSVIGNLFREMQSAEPNQQIFSDYDFYEPANGRAAAFLGEPVVVDGEILGLIVLKLPLDQVNAQLVKTADFQGEGEVILVGEDRLTRNQSPLFEQSTVLKRRLTDAFVRSALEGAVGVDFASFEDRNRFIGYAPFQFIDTKFAVLLVKSPSEGQSDFKNLQMQLAGAAAVTALIFLVLSILFSSNYAKQVRKITQLVGQVSEGRQPSRDLMERGDELGSISRSLFDMNEIGLENTRVRAALDTATTCIMLADEDRNIIYMNTSVRDMLAVAQDDIQEALPNFNVDNIIGKSIDDYHKNPHVQAEILENLEGVHKTRMTLGPRTFDLTAVSVFDQDGDRIGSVVEWVDQTEKLLADSKEKKIDIENQQIRTALDSSNANMIIADQNRQILFANKSMVELLNKYKIDFGSENNEYSQDLLYQKYIEDLHGTLHRHLDLFDNIQMTHVLRLKIGKRSFDCIVSPIIDASSTLLGTVMEWQDKTNELIVQNEMDQVVKSVAQGDFSGKIRLDNKDGFMLALAESINQLKDRMNDVLDEVASSMSAMNKGDLTYTIQKNYSGSFEKIKTDINATSKRLSMTVNDILISSSEITAAASEIAAGSMDLSNRTESQATSLQETAASMEEISTTVSENAKNAQKAEMLAHDACKTASDGSGVINDAVLSMSSIQKSSQKVSDIIGVIDEIAFQTNLLALNAAVEAARAGEAGKGFGVVASEVRVLAQRSSEAAKDIKSLIMESNHQINDGVDQVSNMGEAFHDIVHSTKRVSDIISEIAASSQEQATGVAEINSAITQMDEMTQQNATLVEQSSASAKSLEDQSEKMVQLVSFFNKANANDPKPVSPAKPVLQQRQKTITSKVRPQKKIIQTPPKSDEDAGWEEF